MKSFRLIVHQKNFSGEDLIINPRDYPGAKLNDIVEIYHPPPDDDSNLVQRGRLKHEEEEHPRLLLQIKTFQDDSTQQNSLQKDTISVEQSIAQAFGLQTFKNVTIHIVEQSETALDSIELTFKDQYMGRSEMWRLKNSLVNTCVYMKKNIEFCGGAVRCQVYEMWSQGDRVACGVITEDTKVVFRSSTSMVYLFLQMSSEMWDFDIYGDLYFEKAVNGFLSDLFMKWKKNGSNHEVTIVLFSRTFYEATALEEFPQHMRECLQRDYRGRYYEDFYRVAIQNERYDDWSGILVQLRKLFSEYLNIVLEYHKRPDLTIPAASNSTAAQGNFLEVLNMSLNVFEKHYLDRSFDRTGQLSVVVTPGVGVFEVDRELTNITKQRIIDNGVGSDLVCVGEQPLHAVPLLKFHNKDTHLNVPDDYSMPHWINLSFYSTNKKIAYSSFVPRIKLPPFLPDSSSWTNCNDSPSPKSSKLSQDGYNYNSFFDYDAYDAQIFQLPGIHAVHENNSSNTGSNYNHKVPTRYKRSSGSLLDQETVKGQRRKMSDPDISHHHHFSRPDSNARSEPIAIPPAAVSPPVVSPPPHADEKELSPPVRMVVGSEGSPPLESRALINPFDPSHVTIKLTSNRRRWTHIFPKGPTGVLIQQHHYQAIPAQSNDAPDPECVDNNNSTVDVGKSFCVTAALHDYCKKRPNSQNSSHGNAVVPPKNPSKSLTLLWGATGEQEWTPALTTGVDWKSLTIPACLPITTDYFPDKRALQIDYVFSQYTLLPDSVNADFAQQRSTSSNYFKRTTLSTNQVFKELISQRLAQGFQLILMAPPTSDCNNKSHVTGNLGNQQQSKVGMIRNGTECDGEHGESYYLSIGRLFHKISLSGNTIIVTRYRPRHPYAGFNYQYRYRFHAPHHDTYEESYASFATEKLEHFNWNYLDHYVCTGGDTEFALVEALKFWRFRVYLIPLNNPATKKILEGHDHCDIYAQATATDHQAMVDGILKFIETAVNKIKRTATCNKKARMSLIVVNNAPLIQPRRNSMSNFSQNVNCNSPFRERLGSNRLSERPRPRSGSKVMDRNSRPQHSDTQTVPESPHDNAQSEENTVITAPCLTLSSTSGEIVEAMKNPIHGLTFIAQPNLPPSTFIAADACHWLLQKMEGLSTAEKSLGILQDLQMQHYIRHASGDPSRQFLFGFFLFYIVGEGENSGDLQAFENDWLEVEIKPALDWGLSQNTGGMEVPNTFSDRKYGVPHFLCEDINAEYNESDMGATFKRMRLETDFQAKSDRIEWGHVRYQTTFMPDQAYELICEWLTSSGSIVAELLSSCFRKAQACGLQMIPIPHDPLALPYSSKSDPLRGPIFIPLNIDSLEEKEKIFHEFKDGLHDERLFLLQEAIVQRFGFINCMSDIPNNSATTSRVHQQVSKPRSRVPSIGSKPRFTGRFSVHADVVPSPHEAYITRHVSGKNKDDYDNSRKMGFLWSWNHMLSRKWRSNQGVDNNFQTKLLKDFREFCANSGERLRSFWEDSWVTKEDLCLRK